VAPVVAVVFTGWQPLSAMEIASNGRTMDVISFFIELIIITI
jgi:hypothetical protein